MIDQSPFSIKEFKGIHISDVDSIFDKYSQGDIPFENALECINLDFLKKGGLRTRNGFDTYENTFASTTVIGKPMQAFRIHILNGVAQDDRWLILTWDGTSGRVYDTKVAGPATNPVLTLTGMKYAYCINVFGRVYLTPWKAWAEPNDASGANGWVQVYTGAYNFRTAGGTAPNTTGMAAAIAAGGAMTLGVHYISVLMETDTGTIGVFDSGHVSTPLTVTAAAANLKANLTGIPIVGFGAFAAGVGIAKRHIIMTKVATVVGGGLTKNEPFFAGTINDNVTTTFSIDIPDSALLESAKQYIFGPGGGGGDIIRACVSMAPYNNRMVWNGFRPSVGGSFATDQYAVCISPPNIPEQVSHIDNSKAKLFVGTENTGKVINGTELNGRYYIFGESCTHWIDEREEDPTFDPADWIPHIADPSKGAYPFGISGSGDNPGSASQGLLVVDNNISVRIVAGNHGLSLFNGAFSDIPLSEFTIEDVALPDLKWSQVLVDNLRKKIFWHMGDPDAGSKPEVRIGDFKFGLQLGKVRWGTWQVLANGGLTPIWTQLRPPATVGSVGATADFDTTYQLLSLLTRTDAGSGNWNFRIHSETNRITDFARSSGTVGHWIYWAYESGYTPNLYGEEYQFSWMYLRALAYWLAGGTGGDSTILWQYAGVGDSGLVSIGYVPATQSNRNTMQRAMNLRALKGRARISGTNRAFIQNLTLARAESGKTRPSS